MTTELLPEKTILDAVPMPGVTDYGMPQVCHVAPELVCTSSLGQKFDQRIAGT